MTPAALRALLEDLAAGRATVDDAVRAVTRAPLSGFEDIGDARVDHHRPFLQGTAEVIFGEGKTPEQVAGVARALLGRGANVLVTRANPLQFEAVLVVAADARWLPDARVILVERTPPAPVGTVALVAAGTSDLPVLVECEACARAQGIDTERFVDVGVAGLHRLLAVRERIEAKDVVIVFAGMEAALGSVVGGLTSKPVIAVPTSVGYGASFGGIAALLGMLSSCASGVVVVNIDNGFGAAAAARRLLAGRTWATRPTQE